MDKNNLIGFLLIFGIMLIWIQVTAPTPEEMAEQARQDSIQLVQERAIAGTNNPTIDTGISTSTNTPLDSAALAQKAGQFGAFAPAALGTEQDQVLENEVVKITFTNKGGRIKEVILKKYDKIKKDEERNDVKSIVRLLENPKNQFEYLLPVANSAGAISTGDMYFTPQLNGNTLTFRAPTSNGGYFEQKYTLSDQYAIDYSINMQGLNGVLDRGSNDIKLNWVNYLDRIENNEWFEGTYSGVHYKEIDENPNYCSCRGDDNEALESSIKWISGVNQFFNSTLAAKDNFAFNSADLDIKNMDDESEEMKKITAQLKIPLSHSGNEQFDMKFFVGPNEFDDLRAFSEDLEYIIPYGWSIFGTINRWVVRPFFNFLYGLIGSKGLAIILMTFLVKLVLYPLSYKALYSQQKMAAMKPRLAKLKEKMGDDAQAYQMEQMKLYREYGVSPVGGCLPMMIQMPIWVALFRFFPSAIDFRQESFLWSSDLSSYDDFFHLPFEIPFVGDHLSLFTILWSLSLIAYTYYNSKHMDMSANPAMKYMQYMMPAMFFGIFNSYSSGLTCYYFFSNLLNVAQTLITKNFVINQDKIDKELENYKKDPKNKKKSGFQERLQAALAEQQKKQEQEMKKKKKK